MAYEAFDGCSGLTSLTLPNALTSVGLYEFKNCRGLTYLTLPNALTSVEEYVFCHCTTLTSVVFKPRVSCAFIVWSVSNMRNRANWQLNTIKRLRNVLAIITVYAFEGPDRDVGTVDPGGRKGVFSWCPKLVHQKETFARARH